MNSTGLPTNGAATSADWVEALAAFGEVATDATGQPFVSVELEKWLAVAHVAREQGFWLAWLAAADLSEYPTRLPGDAASGPIQLAACFQNAATSVLVSTTATPTEQLPSLREVFGNADWYEAEISHLLGYTFVGSDSDADVAADADTTGFPLRRHYPLTPRLSTPWPGAESGRRRVKIPGVNPNWQAPAGIGTEES